MSLQLSFPNHFVCPFDNNSGNGNGSECLRSRGTAANPSESMGRSCPMSHQPKSGAGPGVLGALGVLLPPSNILHPHTLCPHMGYGGTAGSGELGLKNETGEKVISNGLLLGGSGRGCALPRAHLNDSLTSSSTILGDRRAQDIGTLALGGYDALGCSVMPRLAFLHGKSVYLVHQALNHEVLASCNCLPSLPTRKH